jgi:succinyl-CoA synthetase beta subunit
MMSMDAVIALGYRIANFVDTSGNPPASKVYRAAKIILSQSGIDGYFASGSGVASQEQFHSARGLVKAFMEEPLRIPAVIRLGGNAEEKAIEILERSQSYIPAPLEGYGKDDSPGFCAERLNALIEAGREETTDFARFVHDKASQNHIRLKLLPAEQSPSIIRSAWDAKRKSVSTLAYQRS